MNPVERFLRAGQVCADGWQAACSLCWLAAISLYVVAIVFGGGL